MQSEKHSKVVILFETHKSAEVRSNDFTSADSYLFDNLWNE